MRKFPRHPVAVLRQLITHEDGRSWGQKEFAALIGKKTITVQKIEQGVENGGLRLSEPLAKRVSRETGAQVAWLLNGDPAAPPLTVTGATYTKNTFDEFRAGKNVALEIVDEWQLPNYALSCHVRIRAIIESAHRHRTDFQIVRYRLDRFLDGLTAEFGQDEKIAKWDIYQASMIDFVEAKQFNEVLLEFANHMAASKRPTASKSPSRRRARKA